jgi:hypothetical protein
MLALSIALAVLAIALVVLRTVKQYSRSLPSTAASYSRSMALESIDLVQSVTLQSVTLYVRTSMIAEVRATGFFLWRGSPVGFPLVLVVTYCRDSSGLWCRC